jgi:hypothetical protein
LALEHGRIVCSKAESVELYRRTAGDRWAKLAGDIYGHCKIDWSYRIPDDLDERKVLRRLCHHVLALERHALERLAPLVSA